MIRVQGLTVAFGSLTAVDDVTLTFHRGQVTVLLGRSGAGKSSLLRCLNYLQVPTRGSVEVEGAGPLRPGRHLREHRRRTGTIFQLHNLLGRQTALKNVLAGRLGYHSTLRSLFPLPRPDVRLALECLGRVGLADKALERADRLSGGERQRVGIARALCQGPRVILADEPVASLDPATASGVLKLLCEVCRQEHVTLVMSLHQVELARRHADRVVGLARGRVVFDGPPAALTDDHLGAIYDAPAGSREGPAHPPQRPRMSEHDEAGVGA
jgi:phosphonate transport system ATP-binding protein